MSNCACNVNLVANVGATKPLLFFLELTPVCNNACPGCSNVFASDRSRPSLSAIEWATVLERLATYQPRLRLTGGEPTLHPAFEQIVKHIQVLGLPFSVFSNARWQEPDNIVELLSDTLKLEYILVSLHGARAESHEAFTAMPGSFDEATANIQRASEASLPVVTSTVITSQNYDEVEDIVTLGWELGAGRSVFNRYIGAPLPDLEPTTEELRTAIQVAERQKEISGDDRVRFGTPIPHCFTPNGSNGCRAGFVHVTIDPWGNVRPCPHVPVTAGNVLNGDGLDAILQSPVMERWRQGLLAQCGDCAEQSSCFAGCQAMALARGLDRDPLIQAHA